MEPTATKTLESVFGSFAKTSEMSNKEFAKLTKDCGLLDKKFTSIDVDIYFVKVKTKTSKNITYNQFLDALKIIAEKKGTTYDALVEGICNTGGPTYSGTKAEYNKFHDDKSLYTGVYAQGGPTNVDKGNVKDISGLCDRTSADVRGVKK